MTDYLLLTTYYLLYTTYYTLPTTNYLLLTIYYLLPTSYALLLATCYLLLATCYLQPRLRAMRGWQSLVLRGERDVQLLHSQAVYALDRFAYQLPTTNCPLPTTHLTTSYPPPNAHY